METLNNKMKTVKDIKTGKPDASDEVMFLYKSLKDFCKRIIIPPKFNIDNLIYNDKIYIVGNKGVGKTALLFYIQHKISEISNDSQWSIILFKSDYDNVKRAQFEKLNCNLISTLKLPSNDLVDVRDFTKLWKLAIYKKIVDDNIKSNYSIFDNDTNWESFQKLILSLSEAKKNALVLNTTIPRKTDVCYNFRDDTYVSEEKISFPKNEDSVPLGEFYEAIDVADMFFQVLNKKDSFYLLCIDELEVYNSDNNSIFLRDLALIRDLIIVIKELNKLITKSKYSKMKAILSVRSEILIAIKNNIPGNEYNKCIDGFEEKIDWGVLGNNDSIGLYHPLFQVWIKRIAEAIEFPETNYTHRIYSDWFPNSVGVEDTFMYFLKRTWYKPRDIIRFMNILNKLSDEDDSTYTPSNIHKSSVEYSKQSLVEITEELGAIYTNAEIDLFFQSIISYKKKFSKGQYIDHLKQEPKFICMLNRLDKIIDDFYRVGIIGCINKNDSERWCYKNESPIYGEEWSFIVHRGLWYEFKLQKESYNGILTENIFGVPVKCTCNNFQDNYLTVSFNTEHSNQTQRGRIHISDITGRHIDKKTILNEELNLFVIGYNEQYRQWILAYNAHKII